MWRRRLLRRGLAGAGLLLLACGSGPVQPTIEPFGDAEVTALFIGNSLTASNDLPGMVATLAQAAGSTFEYRALLRPNFSLQDHWAQDAEEVIRELGADVVILQQGPSSVGDNPLHLRTWTEAYAPVVREAGGEPALLMVWPERTRMEAFDAVHDSYAGAADAVNGIFLPAGDAWREVWALDPDVSLYGVDGFHPSRDGSLVAALTVFAILYDEDVRDLPADLYDSTRLETLYEGVHTTVSR